MLRGLALGGALFLLVLLGPGYAPPVTAATRLPSVMLWAWERPEDLRGLGSTTGVAFLAQTINIENDRIRVVPRMQPLHVDRETMLVAVTRIEASSGVERAAGRRFDRSSQRSRAVDDVADAIVRMSVLPRVAAVQVDFDATASQREFYRALLAVVRSRLPSGTALSITALASWCAADNWLVGLPIDEAVPMLFRMGPFNEPYLDALRTPRGPGRACGGAVGVSLDEPRAIERAVRRVYVFNPKPWTPRTLADARREALR